MHNIIRKETTDYKPAVIIVAMPSAQSEPKIVRDVS
jgi:hypothetical protein